MVGSTKPRAVGLNHVALEVGDIEEALAFYGRIFDFQLRGKSRTMAFIDLGDQFIALQKGHRQPADDGRHFGLVVDDKEAARRALKDAGVTTLDGGFLDFRDPRDQAQNCDLPSDQQRSPKHSSRRAEIPRWSDRLADVSVEVGQQATVLQLPVTHEGARAAEPEKAKV
jgi:catechol 2,3-dioxygenase-like lactoylglutathione lyase family enzyme